MNAYSKPHKIAQDKYPTNPTTRDYLLFSKKFGLPDKKEDEQDAVYICVMLAIILIFSFALNWAVMVEKRQASLCALKNA